MGETARDLSRLELRWRFATTRLLDDCREVFGAPVLSVRDVRHAGIGNPARGVDAVLVAVANRHDAVGGEQDGAVEGIELFLLLPPGVAVVAHQVIVLLERGIVVRRQHLTVGVDVDTGILALLEQLFQVLEVVSGDQDAGASADADVHLGQLGLAVSRGVRLVEQGHDGDGGLACLHHHLDHLVLGEVFGS